MQCFVVNNNSGTHFLKCEETENSDTGHYVMVS